MKIQIGTWTAEYRIFRTTAPREYDAGTTITLYETGSGKQLERMIAVRVEDVEWSLGRYSSGLYTLEDDTDSATEEWATKKILDRIFERKEE